MKKIPHDSRIRPGINQAARVLQGDDPDPCHGCDACCQYVAVEIDKPTNFEDFQNIYWYLVHKDIWVYVDHDKDWHVQFNAKCDKLLAGRCNEYDERPEICRDYMPEHCTRYNEEAAEKILLKDETDLWEYLKYQRPKLYKRFAQYRND